LIVGKNQIAAAGKCVVSGDAKIIGKSAFGQAEAGIAFRISLRRYEPEQVPRVSSQLRRSETPLIPMMQN
jgi:hypothetical protein